MNAAAAKLTAANLLRQPLTVGSHQLQQSRGIRVKVMNGNLEQALAFLQRSMIQSGAERLIKNKQMTHLKNSEKRVLAQKNLKKRLESQEMARRLKTLLIKKIRGL